MDISVLINSTRINVRVAVLTFFDNAVIFEKDKNGFYFPIGGRIKVNETSIDAAIREVNEEIQYSIANPKFAGIIENYFIYDSINFHEICFVYWVDVPHRLMLPPHFRHINISDVTKYDIRPAIMVEIMKDRDHLHHFIVNDKNTQHSNAREPPSPSR